MSEQDLLYRIVQAIKSFKPSLLNKVSSDLQSRLLSVSTVSTDCETLIPLSSLSPAQQAVDAVVDCVITAMTQTSESHQEIDSEPGNELLKFNTETLYLMNIIEQPLFQDITSLFFHNVANTVFVMRLTDEFDDIFFNESEGGKLVGTPLPPRLSWRNHHEF